MKNLVRGILLVAILGGGIWLWRVLFPSDETRIRRQLSELAETASFSADEPPLLKMAAAAGLAGFFTTDVSIELSTWETGRDARLEGVDSVRQAALTSRNYLAWLDVAITDARIRVSDDRKTATAHFVVLVRSNRNEGEFVQELKSEWVSLENRWFIRRLEAIEVLSR